MIQHSLTHLINFALAVGSVGLTLHHKENTCECLNWKETYKRHAVHCGAGSEFFFLTGTNTPSAYEIAKANSTSASSATDKVKGTWGQMLCAQFYEKLDFNTCMNINMGKDEGTWCYVNETCADLNEGSKIPDAAINWKRCSVPGDTTLRDLTPERLYRFSKQHDLALNILDKLAYPGHRGGEEQASFVHTYDFETGSVPMQVGPLINTSQAIFWDTHKSGHVPHVILYNGKAYRVDDALKKDDEHPGTWTKLRCMLGC